MPYDEKLADRVRENLSLREHLHIEEKEMFSGLCFMVNARMCVNVSGNNLMCRIHPSKAEELSELEGYIPMIMKGKQLKGYCYVTPDGFKSTKDFNFWIDLCLQYNSTAKASKKKKKEAH